MATDESDVTRAREAFAEALRVRMARLGINKRDLAHLTRRRGATGISEGTIGKYYRGEQTPRFTELIQIADALDVSETDLVAAAVAVYDEMLNQGATTRQLAQDEITR